MWLGQHQLHKFHNNPLIPVAMARRKRTMFKQLATAKIEDMGDTGGWKKILEFSKQQDSFTSSYLDKVRVSFILEGDSSGSNDQHLGYLWCVSNKDGLSGTDADNTPYIVSASASRGGGGIVTLNINRSIRDNAFDESTGFGKLALYVRMTDTGTESYDLTMITETWGRWHQVTPV